MGAFSTVTLHDGGNLVSGSSAASGGSVAFVPSFIDSNGIATYYSVNDLLDQRGKISISVRQPKAGSQVARVTAKVVVPVLDTSTFTEKLGECIATVEFVIPKVASEADRGDLLAFVANWITGLDSGNLGSPESTEIGKAVMRLESVY